MSFLDKIAIWFELITGVVNVYFINALAAVGLVFLHASFYKVFGPRNPRQARFFLMLAIAWGVNLIYVLLLDTWPRLGIDNDDIKDFFVRLLNTSTFLFFWLASSWKFSERRKSLYSTKSVFGIFAPAYALPILMITHPSYSEFWRLPSHILGPVSVALIGINYHIYFNTTRESFTRMTRYSIVLSLYSYSLLQIGVFTLPPYTSIAEQAERAINAIFFLFGMLFKLVHILGLIQLGESVYTDYQKRSRLVDRAKLSIDLADQMAHELRSPAAELRVRVPSLLSEKLPEGTKRGLEAIGNCTEQILSLMEAFEEFQETVRIDKRYLPESKICNLNTVCDSVIISLKMTTRPRCKIEKRYTSGPVVKIIEAELVQIIRNLLKNAIESVLLRKRKKNFTPTVWVKTEVDEDNGIVRLVVEDNGLGVVIEDEIWDRLDVKDPLVDIFRDGVTTKSDHGRGHGLYIARSHARNNNGDIKVNNLRNNSGVLMGARFTLELQLSR